jgi:surface protein
MFGYLANLVEVDTSKWDTSRVSNMEGMFDGCRALEKLDVSDWNMSNVGNTAYMFSECRNLT